MGLILWGGGKRRGSLTLMAPDTREEDVQRRTYLEVTVRYKV